MDFSLIKNSVANQFGSMSKHQLFRTTAGKEEMWQKYLESFPAGSNPIYRERTEHDCTCCRQFIRTVGNVVAIIDGKLVSIWDRPVDEPSYQAVSKAMGDFVKSFPIENIFLHTERVAGTDKTFEETLSGIQTWQHFFVNIPQNFVRGGGVDIGPALGEAASSHQVFVRGLTTIKLEAVDSVLELIAQNSLYRGEEHKFAVSQFREVLVKFLPLSVASRELFSWQTVGTLTPAVAKIRNTSIGTLLVNLSEGMELENAVRAFEIVVAPANYKRPTALVTKSMVANAKQKIEELGLTSALGRRYAVLSDISVNDVLFADRDARKKMAGDVFDDLAAGLAEKPKQLDKIEEVGIEKFLADILPTANSLEVFLENRLTKNLVSLIGPADPTAKQLFKWENPFSWSYAGEFADSIKERVKAAGGNVTGDFRCSLAWFNTDDLDLHLIMPKGNHIYFGQKRCLATGGCLDVDMNVGMPYSKKPVENIVFPSTARMLEGTYELQVRSYNQREKKDVGFEVEVEFLGNVRRFVYDKQVRHQESITVAKFSYTKRNGLSLMLGSLPDTSASKIVWNLPTESYHKVNLLALSPNYWSGKGVGNKHYMFMLDGCKNDGSARGFFNEFLKPELEPHRKVLEMVGGKLVVKDSPEQLSGLGFSSTQREHLLCRVAGKFTRTIKIVF